MNRLLFEQFEGLDRVDCMLGVLASNWYGSLTQPHDWNEYSAGVSVKCVSRVYEDEKTIQCH